jgi:anti-anti-sigma regulatory factor
MLRITAEGALENTERYRLDGRLAGAYVAELERVLLPSLSTARRIALDLGGVTFVDAEGAVLLKDLRGRNVELHGCSGFVAHLLGLP